MYPSEELKFLAARKASLQEQILERRLVCAEAAERVARPLEMVDHAVAWWHRISPVAKIAAIPAGLILRRFLSRRAKVLGAALRWGPLAFGLLRGFNAGRKASHQR
jgi:hypothetical protein